MNLKNELDTVSQALVADTSVENLRQITNQLLFAVSILENPKSATAFVGHGDDANSAFEGLNKLRI